jgi:hypothetical protein
MLVCELSSPALDNALLHAGAVGVLQCPWLLTFAHAGHDAGAAKISLIRA